MKSELEILFKLLQKDVKYQEILHPSYLEGRVFSIHVDKRRIGIIGEIHPQVILNFKLKQPIVVIELELN